MSSLFQNLPLELRHEIWRHHTPEPRVIKTRYDAATGSILPGSRPPVFLHVCQESRKFLLSASVGFSMQFGSPANPSAVCINAKADAVQINYDALKNNDIEAAVFETVVHLELYGTFFKDSPEKILRQLVKFKNLDTLSLVTPPGPVTESLGQDQDFADWAPIVAHGFHVGVTRKRVLALTADMQKPQYGTWKKPLLNQICPRYDGSRSTAKGEFNPVWGMVVNNIHLGDDFEKSTMLRRLENSRRTTGP